MQLHCISTQLVFECFDGHKVVAGFDGGVITSDAGALLLRHVDKVIGLFERMAACFVDAALRLARSTVRTRWSGSASRRSPWDLEHVDDHDRLRHNPVLRLLSQSLTLKRPDCAVLAGKFTLNRLEHGRLGQPTCQSWVRCATLSAS
ncbi:transposase [Rhizobium laguerreae]